VRGIEVCEVQRCAQISSRGQETASCAARDAVAGGGGGHCIGVCADILAGKELQQVHMQLHLLP
jgi:hypothetical protein